MKKKLIYSFLTILFTFSSVLPALAATTPQGLDQGQVITVSHVSVVNVITTAGMAPVLPSTVTATMSDGTTKTVKVNWLNMPSTQRTWMQNYIVIGTISESTTIKVIATVTVADENQVAIQTTQQVQEDILGTWKTSDQRFTLEFHNDGTLEETVVYSGYSAIYEGHYSLTNPSWIRIVNSSWGEEDNIVLHGDLLEIDNMNTSPITGTSGNFRNTDNLSHPTFSQSNNSGKYRFTKVN